MYIPGGSVVLLITGIFLITMPRMNRNRMLKRCTSVVKARCAGRYTRHTSKGKMYAPVWEYVFNNVSYRSSESVYTNLGKPKVDDESEIYVNPDDPEEIYRVNPYEFITMTITGIAAILLSIIIIYASYKSFR